MAVTSNILQRTFHIAYNEVSGTCFTVDIQGSRYLITARHVVKSIQDYATVEIYRNETWFPVSVRLVGHGKGDIDVTVLAPNTLFGASHALRLTTAKLTLAEDVYFLGFPYGLGMEVKTKLNAGFPLPMVKKAVVSALGLGDSPLFLDGHNNVGFSGGPVVRRGTKGEQTVIGTISAYRAERENVLDENGEETSLTYDTNTGIIFAYDIRHALAIIDANPIGLPVTTVAA